MKEGLKNAASGTALVVGVFVTLGFVGAAVGPSQQSRVEQEITAAAPILAQSAIQDAGAKCSALGKAPPGCLDSETTVSAAALIDELCRRRLQEDNAVCHARIWSVMKPDIDALLAGRRMIISR